jgi:hypothetical protein
MKASHFLAGLLAGSAAGGTGVYLLNGPSAPASPAPVVAVDDSKLKTAESRIADLEKEIASLKTAKPAKEVASAEKSADAPTGEQPMDMSKIIKDAKPLLKSLTSAFEPQRKQMTERMIKEQVKRMTELAGLNPEQSAALQAHLESLDKENQAKWQGMMDKDMNMADLMAMRQGGNSNPQKTMDDWAAANLTGDQAQQYTNKRLVEKTEQITKSANSQVEYIGKDLNLDETQKDKVFNILVQTDKNYDKSMQLQGVDATASVAEGQSREDAIATVLTPEQKQKYTAQQEQRKSRGNRWMQMLGGGREGAGRE